jgi:hypothetical protein
LVLTTFNPVATPVIHEVNVGYAPNRGPTAFPSAPVDGDWIADASPILSWGFLDPEGDGQAAFEINLARDSTFMPIVHSSGIVGSSATGWETPQLEDGLWYWRIRLSDGVTWEDWVVESFGVDSSPPSVSIIKPAAGGAVGSGIVDVSWNANDSLSGVGRIEVKLDTASPLSVDPASTTYSFSGVVDGEHIVTVSATDRTGHLSSATVSFVVDRSDPTVEVTFPESGIFVTSGRVDVLWEADGTGSEIDRFELQLDDGTPVVLAGTERSYSFEGVGDGVHILTLRAIDRAGNDQTSVVRIRVDTAIFSLSGPYGPWPTATLLAIAIVAAALIAIRTLRSRKRRTPPS